MLYSHRPSPASHLHEIADQWCHLGLETVGHRRPDLPPSCTRRRSKLRNDLPFSELVGDRNRIQPCAGSPHR